MKARVGRRGAASVVCCLLLVSAFAACGQSAADEGTPEGDGTNDGGVAGQGGTAAGGSNARADAGGASGTTKGSGGTGKGGASGAGGGVGGGSATGCAALTATQAADATTYAWSDAQCNARALSTDDAKGVIASVTYKVDGADRVCGETPNGWTGFGYLVSDTGLGICQSKPTVTQPLQGAHHAIHRFGRPTGCSTNINVDLFFATGRDHPIIAISYDTSKSGATGDSRFPYGDLRFDGASDDGNSISGLGWGDTHKFRTTTGLTELATTGWDYTATNTIPYDFMWIDNPDAEMGLVQTQTYAQQDAGGYDYGGTSTTKKYWGTSSASGPMPSVVLWPYQLNQYSTPNGQDTGSPWYTTSKRFAWGTQTNAVGSTSYTGVDGTKRSGKPHFGYALFFVLGKHSTSVTDAAVEQVENVQGTTLTAQTGTVLAEGPVGAGRTATTSYQPAGYNHVYSTWEVSAQANQASVTLTAPAAGLLNPILVVHQYDSPSEPTVTVDGAALQAGKGFVASHDATGKALWITLFGTYAGARVIAVSPTS